MVIGENVHLRGVIKKYVDCIYKIENPYGTSINNEPFLNIIYFEAIKQIRRYSHHL